MSIKYLALNALLCLVVFLIAIKNYEIWSHPIELVPNTGIESKKAETKNENPAVTASAKETIPVQSPARSPIQSYVPISEKNIFSPERKDFPTVTAGKPNPVARPQVILYGVTIAGDYQAASVVNPGRPLYKGERETKTIKIGDQMGGYKLAKIMPDRITMEAPGDSFDVLLYDPKAPKKRVETRIAEAKTGQPSPAGPVGEAEKSVAQLTVDKTTEPVPEQLVPPRPIPPRGPQSANRILSRQERSALISQRNASQR